MADAPPAERDEGGPDRGRRRALFLAAGPWAAAIFLALPNPGSLTGLQNAPPILAIALVCLLLTFLTEVTSNTATTTTMLPIATSPNAIVFGSGRVTIARMARVGIRLNLIGVIVLTLVLRLVGLPALGVGAPPVPPIWAG